MVQYTFTQVRACRMLRVWDARIPLTYTRRNMLQSIDEDEWSGRKKKHKYVHGIK